MEEGAKLKAPAALHSEANQNDKLFVANDDIIVSSRTTTKHSALPSEDNLKKNARVCIKQANSLVPVDGPQWEKLDYKMIISDYVYGGNRCLTFGESIQ